MPATPPDGVALLERSLGYARVVLAGVRDADLDLPTPCPGWRLGDLLAHVDDGLDAFTEAAAGRVHVAAAPVRGRRAARAATARLSDKACHLLGVWSAAPGGTVHVGDQRLPAGLLAGTAALEIAVHAWDATRSLGHGPPLPPHLAHDLWPLAQACVEEADRGVLFAPARPCPPGAGDVVRLLAHLGRDPAGPVGKGSGVSLPRGWAPP